MVFSAGFAGVVAVRPVSLPVETGIVVLLPDWTPPTVPMTISTTIGQNHQRLNKGFFPCLLSRRRGFPSSTETAEGGGYVIRCSHRNLLNLAETRNGFPLRAVDRIRTGDLRITRALLCQLSYDGEDRSGMRNGGWAMRAKEYLSRDRLMPPIANYLPFGNPAFRMWPLGPSCFDGIRTRITLKGHPIGWKTKPCCGYDAGEAVLFRPLRCRPAP